MQRRLIGRTRALSGFQRLRSPKVTEERYEQSHARAKSRNIFYSEKALA